MCPPLVGVPQEHCYFEIMKMSVGMYCFESCLVFVVLKVESHYQALMLVMDGCDAMGHGERVGVGPA